jgi:hypothetical protein
VIVLGVGLLLLLDRMRLFGRWEMHDLWPLFVIFLGAARVMGDGRDRRGGLTLLLMGCWMLINTLHLFDLSWHSSWPLVLVAVGLAKGVTGRSLAGRSQGLYLIVMGGLMQALVLGAFGLDLRESWPLILIAIGFWIVLRAFHDGDSHARKEAEDEKF